MHSAGLHSRRPPAAPFDSFFSHRTAPHWSHRGALLLALGAATAAGCAILLSALTLLA